MNPCVKLAEIKINNIPIIVYSNGSSDHISQSISTDDHNYYLGISCQCVELVRRYILHAHNINLARQWQEGNACDWLEHREKMGLVEIMPEAAQTGDIITFTGGLYGHVGLIKTDNTGLYMVSQNLFNDMRDIKTFLPPEILQKKKPLAQYKFQSILTMGY